MFGLSVQKSMASVLLVVFVFQLSLPSIGLCYIDEFGNTIDRSGHGPLKKSFSPFAATFLGAGLALLTTGFIQGGDQTYSLKIDGSWESINIESNDKKYYTAGVIFMVAGVLMGLISAGNQDHKTATSKKAELGLGNLSIIPASLADQSQGLAVKLEF